MARKSTARVARNKRHVRVRLKVHGTAERPRLSVFRSSQHIYAQVIDDVVGNTLAAASTIDPVVREQAKSLNKVEEAAKVGQLVAQRALEKGVTKVVYDRGGYLYHGRVEALARGAREVGLDF